ncbi:MAG: HK97 gp10 family phage protein [Arcobacteraceae bacterium]
MNDIDKKHIEAFLFRVGSEIANDAKDLAPYATGNLERDIQVFDDNISNLEIEIGNSKLTPYARFVHDGTEPHEIRPKNKKALKTPFGVRKKVNHPGTKANPYLQKAVDNYNFNPALSELGDKISEDVFESIKKSLKKK